MKQWKIGEKGFSILEETGFHLFHNLVSLKETLEISIQGWNEGKGFAKDFPRVWLMTKEGFTTKLGLGKTNDMQDQIWNLIICKASLNDLEMNAKQNRRLRNQNGTPSSYNNLNGGMKCW